MPIDSELVWPACLDLRDDRDAEAKGIYKVPYNLIFFPTRIILNLDFLPKNLRLLPHLIFFPTSSISWEDDIASPFLFFHVIFYPTAIIFPSPLNNLKISPPPGRNFIHPCRDSRGFITGWGVPKWRPIEDRRVRRVFAGRAVVVGHLSTGHLSNPSTESP